MSVVRTLCKMSLCVPLLFVGACDRIIKKKESSQAAAASSSVSAAATAAPARPTDDAVCVSSERKVWSKWANRRTGLTIRRARGRALVGVAFGNKPHVLSFDEQGKGSVKRVALHAGSALQKDVPRAEGRRDLQRVTPYVKDGKTTAYVDYRDKRKKRRRIACEAAGQRRALLLFDNKPLLLREEQNKQATKKPEAAAKKPEAARAKKPEAEVAAKGKPRSILGRLKLPPRAAAVTGKRAAVAEKVARPAAPGAPLKALARTVKKREVRDCRSFVDADGSAWAVGSELVGTPKDDQTKWSMRFFVAPDGGRGYIALETIPLPDSPRDPKDLHTLEAPAATRLADGSHVLIGRYRGSLRAWLLDPRFHVKGRRRSYRGGYPSLPRFFLHGGSQVMVLSQKVAEDRWQLRSARFKGGSSLPKALSELTLDGAGSSLAEPTLALAGSQRWLAYHAGGRRSGRLSLMPVDPALRTAGRSHELTEEGTTVYESAILPLAGGKLLALSIQLAEPGAELVSEVLSCDVKS